MLGQSLSNHLNIMAGNVMRVAERHANHQQAELREHVHRQEQLGEGEEYDQVSDQIVHVLEDIEQTTRDILFLRTFQSARLHNAEQRQEFYETIERWLTRDDVQQSYVPPPFPGMEHYRPAPRLHAPVPIRIPIPPLPRPPAPPPQRDNVPDSPPPLTSSDSLSETMSISESSEESSNERDNAQQNGAEAWREAFGRGNGNQNDELGRENGDQNGVEADAWAQAAANDVWQPAWRALGYAVAVGALAGEDRPMIDFVRTIRQFNELVIGPINANADFWGAVPTPMPENALEAMPLRQYKEAHEAGAAINEECNICIESFAPEDEVRVFACCKLAQHQQCLEEWFQSHDTCVVCRQKVLDTLRQDQAQDRSSN